MSTKIINRKEKNITKNIFKIVLAAGVLFSITACEEETENNQPIEEVQIVRPPVDESIVEDDGFEREAFSFSGKVLITEDTFIKARHVHFRSGAVVKINQFSLSLEAKTVTFESNSSLIAYYPNEYAPCKKDGLGAGVVEVVSEYVSGSPFVDLAGQNSGQIGIYNDQRLSAPVESSHKSLNHSGKIWYRGCQTYVKDKYPKDVPHLFKHKVGGEPGALLISSKNYDDFSPLLSNRTAHGSYEALIEGISKSHTSWWRTASKGPDNQPGEVCFHVSGEYLCK